VGGILLNFEMKNVISTHTTDFSWKNGPNSPDFEVFSNLAISMISSGR